MMMEIEGGEGFFAGQAVGWGKRAPVKEEDAWTRGETLGRAFRLGCALSSAHAHRAACVWAGSTDPQRSAPTTWGVCDDAHAPMAHTCCHSRGAQRRRVRLSTTEPGSVCARRCCSRSLARSSLPSSTRSASSGKRAAIAARDAGRVAAATSKVGGGGVSGRRRVRRGGGSGGGVVVVAADWV